MGAAKHARDLLAEGEADDEIQSRVTTAISDLEWEQGAARDQAAEAERDGRLLDQLEMIRGSLSEHWDSNRTDAEYAATFREFAMDLDRLDPKEAGKMIAQRSKPVELASHLDIWALERRRARDKKDTASWQRLFAAANVADPDPLRVALRDQIVSGDREPLLRLTADGKSLEAQPVRSLVLLARGLKGQRERAAQVLRLAWRLDPGDFWVNFELAHAP